MTADCRCGKEDRMAARKTERTRKQRRTAGRGRDDGPKRTVPLAVSLARAIKETKRDAELLGVALTRVRNTAQARLRWLLGFMQRDLDGLRQGDWLNLYDDLRALTFKMNVAPGSEPTAAEVRSLQREIEQIIAAVVRGGSWSFELPKLRHVIGRTLRGRVIAVARGDLRSQVLLATEKVLEAEGHRLKACLEPKCQKIFVAMKRQAYCSVRCSQRARTRRFLKLHSKDELSEKRHQAYKRRLEKETGRPTRVTRRTKRQRQEGIS